MNDSSEIRSLVNSMACLVSTITEIIDAKVKAANAAERQKTGTAAMDAAPVKPRNDPASEENFIGFRELCQRIPLSEKTLREAIKRGRIPSIRLPRGRRVLFHWNSVETALVRFQRGEY